MFMYECLYVYVRFNKIIKTPLYMYMYYIKCFISLYTCRKEEIPVTVAIHDIMPVFITF